MLVVRDWNSKMVGKRLHGCLLLLVFLLANASGTCDVAFAAVVASISFSLSISHYWDSQCSLKFHHKRRCYFCGCGWVYAAKYLRIWRSEHITFMYLLLHQWKCSLCVRILYFFYPFSLSKCSSPPLICKYSYIFSYVRGVCNFCMSLECGLERPWLWCFLQ